MININKRVKQFSKYIMDINCNIYEILQIKMNCEQQLSIDNNSLIRTNNIFEVKTKDFELRGLIAYKQIPKIPIYQNQNFYKYSSIKKHGKFILLNDNKKSYVIFNNKLDLYEFFKSDYFNENFISM